MKNINKQEEFQKLANQQIPLDLSEPSISIRRRRLNLALEELIELSESFGLATYFSETLASSSQKLKKANPYNTYIYNKVEALDACVDIEYINNGTIIECGFKNVYDSAYTLVHNNNMSKGHKVYQSAEGTANIYRSQGVPCSVVKVNTSLGKLYSVIRQSDGKLLKPKNFKNVDLKSIL